MSIENKATRKTAFFEFTCTITSGTTAYLKREETGEEIPFDENGQLRIELKCLETGALGEAVTVTSYGNSNVAYSGKHDGH